MKKNYCQIEGYGDEFIFDKYFYFFNVSIQFLENLKIQLVELLLILCGTKVKILKIFILCLLVRKYYQLIFLLIKQSQNLIRKRLWH